MIAGIDLGTTNSVIAVISDGKPLVIPSSEGERSTPSIVALDPSTNEWRLGTPAKRQSVTNPDNSVLSIKRLIGRKFTDSIVQDNMSWLQYKLTDASNNDCEIAIGGNRYRPEEIAAKILGKLKTDAQAYLGEEINEAVIAVPAYFNGNQRRAITDAGRIAGLYVVRLISETAAASIAYGMDRREEETIAVYRLGGGTFEMSFVDMGGGVFQVLSISGDTRLGGDDFDRRIIKWVSDELRKQYRMELCQDKMMLQMLWRAVEAAKCELSSVHETEINLPFIATDVGEARHLSITLARDRLEELTTDLVETTLVLCRQAFADAKEQLKKDKRKLKIDKIIMSGGQTRMPLVQEKVRQLFRKPAVRVTEDSVAIGAAVLAGILGGYVMEVLLLDAIPHTLGVETEDGVMRPVISRNAVFPTSASEVFSIAYDNQLNIEVHLLEGENPRSADNESLGRLIFQGVPPAPKGVSQIEVTFNINSDRILWVGAEDRNTGEELQCREPELWV